MKKTKYFYGIFIALVLIVGFFGLKAYETPQQVAFTAAPGQGVIYTTASGFVAATTTVNTTSTQIFASINQIDFITNSSTATLTCSLDARGTTAASSSVTAGRGVIIGPTTNSSLPPRAAFGQCASGDQNCYPHTGAVNCVASASTTITTLVQ